MTALGIRAEPQQATFVIFNSEDNCIVNIEKLVIPAIFNLPERLKFARYSLIDIMREYQVSSAGIRVAEGNSQNQDADRLYLEAVFMESFASSNIQNYFVGRKSSIASRLGISIEAYDEITSGRDTFRKVKNWPSTKSAVTRDAILVSMVAAL